ncbi:hypothetical protein Taro_052729 [Colocasia esculenta]|uniref:Uncharacterized protein n=1 Tax=Colocasia esculenta TaxID=4460 RepID=A0A843XJ58_COLES|nr:hypothetical protein [Colocasia esculenta]
MVGARQSAASARHPTIVGWRPMVAQIVARHVEHRAPTAIRHRLLTAERQASAANRRAPETGLALDAGHWQRSAERRSPLAGLPGTAYQSVRRWAPDAECRPRVLTAGRRVLIVGFFVLVGACRGVCFRIVFDSAGSAAVVLGPTLVVGRGISLFRCFVVLCGRDSLSQEFIAGRSWWRLVLRACSRSSSLLVLVEVRFPQNCVVLASGCCGVALWVEVHRLAAVFWWCFPELFVVVLVSVVWLVVVALPSRLRCIARLPCVLVRFPRIVGCYPGLRYAAFVLAGAFWWVFQNGALVVLVEVLPEPVVTVLGALSGGSPQCYLVLFWLSLLSLCGDELSMLPVGLFMLQSAWVFSVKGREVGFVSRALWALPDGSLVSAMGAWLFVLLWKCRSRLVGAHCCDLRVESSSLELFWVELVAPLVPIFLGIVRCVFLLCLSCALEALVAVGRVALPTCGGRSGALCLHASKSQYGCCALEALCALVRKLFGVRGIEFSTSETHCAGRALWLYRYRCGVAALPCLVVVCPGRTTRMIWVGSSGVGGHCLACRGVLHMHAIAWFWVTIKKLSFGLAVVFLVGVVRAAPVELSTSACVLCAVVVRLVSRRMSGVSERAVWLSRRHGWARSGRGVGGRRVTVGNATPRPVTFWGPKAKCLGRLSLSPFLSLLLPFLLSEEGSLLPSFSGGGAWRSGGGSCGAVAWHRGSEEVAAVVS